MASIATLARAEKLAPWIGGLVVALPVLIVAFPPMADLPLHEASIGLLRHWSDPTFCPHQLYFINLGQANQLFSLVVLALSYLMPIQWATKTGVALTLVALPVAAGHFADHLRAPRWTALLVAPLGLGWLFFWGLIQNLVGLAALLALLPTIDRFAKSPTRRGAIAVCAGMVLMHFAHQAMQILAGILIVVCTLGASWRWRDMALRSAPVLLGAAIVVTANRYSWKVAGPRLKATYSSQWDPPMKKISDFSGVLFAGYEPYIRNLVFVLVLVPVAMLLAERVRGRDRGPRSWTERAHAMRFEIFATAMLVLYMVAPHAIKSTTLVYHRFLPPAWAVFAVSCATGTAATARLLPRLLCA
ncbi:MAG: hypothetical protein ACRENE_02175, partial [Polyangiaceae bacterium]